MSAKNRATGGTEDEFQVALVTYTKAGNKTAAMRRLWNAAYEMGKSAGDDAVFEGRMVKEEQVKEKEAVEAAKRAGFEEGRWTGFEEGRQAGEKEASSMDAFEVSFAAGKVAGIATGMERGREAETQRWKDGGHFENGTCHTLNATIVDSSFPPQSLPIDDAADTFLVPGAFSAHAGLNWADDTESLPIHSVLVTPQPCDFSDLRTSSTNPFDTLQRRHARHAFLDCYAVSAYDSVRPTCIQIIQAWIIHRDPRVDMDLFVWPFARAHFCGLEEKAGQATRTLPCRGGQMR
ncbi:hypothetical protein B0H19DRAFT_1097779 [Mycena capillaripes]|nr:hypothetical protein B0H19DRAFT_1097779 [Mycena capillaripes]